MKTTKAILVFAGVLCLLFFPVSSKADTITYPVKSPSPSMPPGTYGSVTVDLITTTQATITLAAANYPLIALGDGGILAVNPTGNWTVNSYTSGLTNVGAGKVDGIGYFKLAFDDGPGFSNPYASVFVTLDLSSGTWATAADVLMSTFPIQATFKPGPEFYYEHSVGGHFGIWNGSKYDPTGWVAVSEPGILILLGIAMTAIGIAVPLVRKI